MYMKDVPIITSLEKQCFSVLASGLTVRF